MQDILVHKAIQVALATQVVLDSLVVQVHLLQLVLAAVKDMQGRLVMLVAKVTWAALATPVLEDLPAVADS